MLTQTILGSPRAQCNGAGICKIIPFNTLLNCNCPKIIADIEKLEGDVLRFSFHKAGISDAINQKHFGNATFRVASVFVLPEFVLQKLSLSRCCIQTGTYTVRETTDTFIVEFTTRRIARNLV